LRAPLNYVLGTEASVRVFRALAGSSEPLARREIARRTRLNPSGLPTLLRRLELAGAIESVGVGRERPFRLRTKFPLSAALRQLFDAESQHTTGLFDRLRDMAWNFGSQVDAAWIEGPVAEETDDPNDVLVLSVLVPASSGLSEEQLRSAANDIQRRFDIAIETRIWRKPDLESLPDSELRSLASAIPLVGLPPLQVLGREASVASTVTEKRPRTHADHDLSSHATGRAVAELLRSNPDLRRRALEYIQRTLQSRVGGIRLDLQEWRDILEDYSLARLRSFLESNSERAIRLRQSAPFAAVLSTEERASVRQRARELK
jgi:hypothetical protein